MSAHDLQNELLRQLSKEPAGSQRVLAAHMGVSVGKINYCLRALIEKGWVKASNFRRSDNKIAYAYLLTPSGIKAKSRLTRDFLKSKLAQFERLQAEIDTLRRESQQTRPER